MLCLIYFCFDILCPYGVVLSRYKKRLHFPFLRNAWLLLLLLLLLFTPLVFHTSISQWFFTGVWVTASLLADLNNAVVWMVSTHFHISKSSCPRTNPLVTVPRVAITNWYNCHFHVPQFFQFPCEVQVLIFLFAFFQFYSVVSQDNKIYNSASSFSCWLLQGLVVWPRLGDPFVSQNPKEVCAFHSPRHSRGCAYTIYSCTIPSGSPSPPSRV